MRKLMSALLVLVMLVSLMVPCAMAAEADTKETESSSLNGGGFTDKLLSAETPAAETEEPETNVVANIVVFAALAVVVGVSVAMIIDKKKKLYK